jgi:tetratricopeptide (TPR) repeat protein
MNTMGILDQAEQSWAIYLWTIWSACQWDSLSEEEQIYCLSHMANHLKQAMMRDKLYALIDDQAFRQLKLESLGSVYELCSDITLALDVSLENDDLPRIAQYGFLYSDYYEGRLGVRDILHLYQRNPEAAHQEIKIYYERPRFQLLLWLALLEAEEGHSIIVNEVVSEANKIRGCQLPPEQAGFVANAVSQLLATNCNDAAALLRTAFPPDEAILQACKLAQNLRSEPQYHLLTKAIEWLKEIVGFRGSFSKSVPQLFASVGQSIGYVRNKLWREKLLKSLEAQVKNIEPPQKDMGAMGVTDVGFLVALELIASDFGAGSRGRVSKVEIIAALGAALVRGGYEERGYTFLEEAVESCNTEFNVVTQALRTISSASSNALLVQLLNKAQNADQLQTVLETLGDDSGGPGLGEALEIINTRLKTFGWQKTAEQQYLLVRAYSRLKEGIDTSRERHFSDVISSGLAIASFTAWNPLVNSRIKYYATRDSIYSALLMGQQGKEWAEVWLGRLTQWLIELSPEKSRLRELRTLLQVIKQVSFVSGFTYAMQILTSLSDESVRAEAFSDQIEYIDDLPDQERTLLRNQILSNIRAFVTNEASNQVWSSWLSKSRSSDLPQLLMLQAIFSSITDPTCRAERLGMLASALCGLGQANEARAIWYQAALAYQDATANVQKFAAKIAALTHHTDRSGWGNVLAAIGSPDPTFAARIVELAADHCEDTIRLIELEEAVQQIGWHPALESSLFPMYISLARNWARHGNPGRGGELVSRWLSKNPRAIRTSEKRRKIFETIQLFSNHPIGRELYFKLIPQLAQGDANEIDAVASACASVSDKGWAQIAISELYLSVAERSADDPASQWQTVGGLAKIASSLARHGRIRLAHQILQRIGLPTIDENQSNEFLARETQALALARLSDTYCEIHLAEAELVPLSMVSEKISAALSATTQLKDQSTRHLYSEALATIWHSAMRLRDTEMSALSEQAYDAILAIGRSEVSDKSNLRSLAIVSVEGGHFQQALNLARQIASDSEREAVLTDLTRLLVRKSFPEALHCWNESSTLEGRREIAREIGHYWLQMESQELPPPKATTDDPDVWTLPKQRDWPAKMLFALSTWSVVYGLIYSIWKWILADFINSLSYLGLFGVTVVLILILNWIGKQLGAGNIFRQIIQGIFILLAFPTILGPILFYEPYKKIRSSFRRWLSARRIWQYTPNGPFPHLMWQPAAANLTEFKQLLFAAVKDSESFDYLLSTFILVTGHREQLDTLLDQLPTFQIPTALPATIEKAYRDEAERKRQDRKLKRFSQWVRKSWLVKLIIALFGAIGRLLRMLTLLIWGVFFLIGQFLAFILSLCLGVTAVKLTDLGRPRLALPLFRWAIMFTAEQSPNKVVCLANYGRALSEAGNFNEAAEAYREAVKRGIDHPEEYKIWYGLGRALWLADRDEEALEPYDKVLAIAPKISLEYREAQKGRQYCLDNIQRRASGNSAYVIKQRK